jgi:predicted ATPase
VHFHEFMQGVNARLHAVRSSGVRGDPLSVVARDLTNEHWMLCFDEVQVTDVGDAMVLRRLFEGLYENGLVMLATSNRAPSELYAGGLQRELFMPFVSLLNARCGVHHLASPNDHRLRVLSGGRGAGSASSSPWLCPAPSLDPREHAAGLASVSRAFESAWEAAAAAHGEAECPQALPVEGQGRDFLVPRALPKARAARFTFSELCGAPLYAGDYAALTRHFGHLFLEGIPVLGMGERNELRRLVTLVDILYDSKVRLTASAAADPTETFRVDDEEHQGSEGQARARRQQLPSSGVERISIAPSHHKAKYDEVFAWDRAVSRLIEMGSSEYAA